MCFFNLLLEYNSKIDNDVLNLLVLGKAGEGVKKADSVAAHIYSSFH
jgi:hypothetical protein